MNKVILVGHLGADPELRETERGNKVAHLSLATNESFKGKTGEPVERTDWHNLEIWGNLAETASKILHKGTMILVEGKLRTDSWKDQEGKQRYSTKVRVDHFQILVQAGAYRKSPESGELTGQETAPEPKA